MSYLKFEKEQLVNLEYSLFRELIRSNRAGSYMSTTLNGCNTRKYHGLLVCPVKAFGGDKHVLLSALDVTLLQQGEEFEFGIHRYSGGHYHPTGHQYLSSIEIGKIPKFTYNTGGAVVSLERLLVENEQQILLKYTLEESNSPATLRFKPFLAFRGIHHLAQANLFANTKLGKAANGISSRMYSEYPDLYMQLNKKNEFIPVPDWYYNFEYLKEKNRGYDYLEDLFVPGYFEVPVKVGESIIFSAATTETNPSGLKKLFTAELGKKTERDSFLNTLKVAAGQFIMRKGDETDVVAGYHWYNSISRQTFVSLPGLSLAPGNRELFPDVLRTYKKYLKNGLFPDSINEPFTWNSADTSLWYIWAIQQLVQEEDNAGEIWDEFGRSISEILDHYRKGTWGYIRMDSDGLIVAEKVGAALTWMNSFSGDRPVLPREGKPVEVNALWYNAIRFAIGLADKNGAETFSKKWRPIAKKAGDSFLNTFCDNLHEGLADCVNGNFKDWSVRPNMVIAASLEYTPLNKDQVKAILGVAKKQLLTPRGLRTLSPDHIRYHGDITGNPDQREQAMHQGAVWPWLIQFFAEGYLKTHRKGGLQFVRNAIAGFEEEMSEHCIGTISETYNGTPPFKAKGAVSQAWSVAAIFYAYRKIQEIT